LLRKALVDKYNNLSPTIVFYLRILIGKFLCCLILNTKKCFFSKNKPVLKDLIPEGHIDIHSHLLPGIDDGAKHLRTASCDLREALQGFGVTDYHDTAYHSACLG
jgi:hypothetical protein